MMPALIWAVYLIGIYPSGYLIARGFHNRDTALMGLIWPITAPFLLLYAVAVLGERHAQR